uniref:Large conductance mechanosensitive channel protein n=1 Tax=viral metagenome TaxID=1070528 RepID=A0A6C0JPQ9_9ZZZZ
MNSFNDQLKSFILDNNVIGFTAGVCIGFAIKDTIQSLIKDLFVPLMIIFLSYLNFNFLIKLLPGKGKSGLNITSFISQMLAMIIMIVVTFLFIKYSISLLGIKNKNNNNKDGGGNK